MSSNPSKDFINALVSSMHSVANQKTQHLSLQLGTITEKGIKIDSYDQEVDEFYIPDYLSASHLEKITIPKGNQLVSGIQKKSNQTHSFAGIPSFQIIGSQSGLRAEGSYGDTTIDLPVVNQCTWTWENGTTIPTFEVQVDERLQIGDRVLVASINNGREWVVLLRIVPYVKS